MITYLIGAWVLNNKYVTIHERKEVLGKIKKIATGEN